MRKIIVNLHHPDPRTANRFQAVTVADVNQVFGVSPGAQQMCVWISLEEELKMFGTKTQNRAMDDAQDGNLSSKSQWRKRKMKKGL